jgi:ABC-2 type transport system permease protein
MTTSDSGLLVADDNTTTEGQYILGATSVETFEDTDDTESRLTVVTAVDLVSDDIPTSYSNMDIFISAVNANFSNVQNIVIPSKSLDVGTVSIGHPIFWSVIFIGIIPLAFIVGGLVYWIRRRNR